MGGPGYMYAMIAPQKESLVMLVPPMVMESKVQKLREMPMSAPGRMAALRLIGENSEQVFFDVQGRVRIPDRLLRAGKLTEPGEKVVLIGALDKIELWPLSLKPQTEEIKGEDMAKAFELAGF